MARSTEERADPRRRGGRAALDVLLTESPSFGGASRFVQPVAAARTLAGLAKQPGRAARRAAGLGGELTRIAAGRSQLTPAKGDRRFGDRAWQENWMLRRLLQSYLAVGDTIDGLISDADMDWRAERQARFMATNLMDAFAPTNFPLTNPAVLKETIDRGGANLAMGARRLVRDVSRSPRLPATVDTSRFEVGGNLAVTPGSIVLHSEVFELIQYAPTTETVHERPLLIVPPTINKYYVLDLAPGRSLVEHLVAQGHQVFMISWRNPDAEHAHFDLDTYAAAVLEAREAVASIAEQDAVHVAAACSGGIISGGAVGHLAASGRLGEVASLTLMVCALDNRQAGTTAALTSRQVAAAAMAESARRGYLDGRSLAGVFAWLRPNDMIWGYVVNNYLLGKAPPAFDILYWNQDTVRLAAGLHRDFIHLALENDLVQPGEHTVLSTPVSLLDVDLDSYVVAGSNDHIVPWENAYRSTQVLGGRPRFVLSTSGHIQALINPPSPESRSSYRVADEHPEDPDRWQELAAKKRGSWWPDYVAWLSERSGEQREAPSVLGNDRFRATAKAPGIYVHAG